MAVLHMPVLKEVKDRVYQQPSSVQDLSYAQTGEGSFCDLAFKTSLLFSC